MSEWITKEEKRCLYCGKEMKLRHEWEDGRPVSDYWECNCPDTTKERQVIKRLKSVQHTCDMKKRKLQKACDIKKAAIKEDWPKEKYEIKHINEHRLVKK